MALGACVGTPPHGDGPERPQLDKHQPVLGPLDVGALDPGNYRPIAAHCESVRCWSVIRRSRAALLLGRIEIRLKAYTDTSPAAQKFRQLVLRDLSEGCSNGMTMSYDNLIMNNSLS